VESVCTIQALFGTGKLGPIATTNPKSTPGDNMLSLKKCMATIVLLVVTANIQAADIIGIWITEKSEAGSSMAVEIFDCDGKLCGKAIDVFDAPNRDSVGIEIIKGMKKKSETSYKRGKIYAPDTKKWYKSKMKLESDDKLKVSGCVLGGVICRSQIWTRQK